MIGISADFACDQKCLGLVRQILHATRNEVGLIDSDKLNKDSKVQLI